jgi:hypothetical protein
MRGVATSPPISDRLQSAFRRARWDVRIRRRRRPAPLRWPAEATAARSDLERRLREVAAAGAGNGSSMALQAFSFSGEADLPEQVASLRSLLANAGTPERFTVISDGTHSAASRALLGLVDRCVSVVDWHRFVDPGMPSVLWDYARLGWRGKKLAALFSLPRAEPVLYTDSDILFFPRASELAKLGARSASFPLYLRDCGGRAFLDRGLLRDAGELDDGVNSGFFFHPHGLDWALGLERLKLRLTRPGGRAGQTVVHLAMHRSCARAFDDSRYVVANDDRRRLDDPYVHGDTVLRHYVTPVRHKFWLALSRLPTALGIEFSSPAGEAAPATADVSVETTG